MGPQNVHPRKQDHHRMSVDGSDADGGLDLGLGFRVWGLGLRV